MYPTGVFLDRDDTLIRDRVYLSDPEGIEILPGVPQAIAQLNAHGIPAIIVTNQSGIARGLFDEKRLAEIHARLTTLLAARGARIDAIYYCPHHPEGIVAQYRLECPCRKPEPGMLIQAARDFALDLTRCYLIGDQSIDIATIKRVGGTGIQLVPPGTAPPCGADHTAPDLEQAVEWILRKENLSC